MKVLLEINGVSLKQKQYIMNKSHCIPGYWRLKSTRELRQNCVMECRNIVFIDGSSVMTKVNRLNDILKQIPIFTYIMLFICEPMFEKPAFATIMNNIFISFFFFF